MKKYFGLLTMAIVAAFTFTGCEDVPSPYITPDKGITDGSVQIPVSTKDTPLTVAQAQLATGNNYVRGYIVGYLPNAAGMNLTNVVFAAPTSANDNTNIVLAESADETNGSRCLPVALPSGEMRSALNLVDNAQLLGQEILLYGSSEKYFGAPGLKNVSWAQLADREIGKDPEGSPSDELVGEKKGDGSQANPYNVTAALAYIRTLSKDDKPQDLVYTAGKISQVVKLGTSKSIQFRMSDDGTPTNDLLVYYCNNLGNVPFEALTDLKVGDDVVVCGKVVNYQGTTPEYDSSTWLYSLNGKTEAEGGKDQDGDKEGDGDDGDGDELDGMTVSALPSDITANGYGTQAVASEGTWVNWTWNDVDFTGCKICKATIIDGTIQMQGHASDASKQGFIYNKTAWAKDISKITLVLKVNSAYEPSYNLYAGSAMHPTSEAATCTSSMKEADGIKTYTQVFDLTGTNARYFTIWNNQAGALYVEKVVVE